MDHRILVVDDHRLNQLASLSILEKLGYEVVGVRDGKEAVDAEATGDFDAIVMDLQMPKMDGFQATAEIRRRQVTTHCARTPIIGLSARAMEGDREVAIAKGMDAYLTKPVNVRELRAVLELCLVDGDTLTNGTRSLPPSRRTVKPVFRAPQAAGRTSSSAPTARQLVDRWR